MANLALRDNRFFQDVFDLRRDFDQAFSRMLTGWPSSENQSERGMSRFAPAVESYIDKDTKTYHCRVALPGIDPKDVQIQVQRNTLMLSGERQVKRSGKEAAVQYEEISYGAFERTLPLPEGVDSEKLTAEYQNGVLEITAPISAAALPRKIEVKTKQLSRQASA
jgi:HSP20 family protein